MSRPSRIMTASDFQAATDVSRETLARLEIYADLLIRWQRKINLVGVSTIADLWHRHMFDSAQLFPLIPADARTLADLGSGAGFPGLVLAIMGAPGVHLIDSDQRKGLFLREVIRETATEATVHSARIETLSATYPQKICADVVTARALAPLADLLNLGFPMLSTHGICLFLKGRTAARELTDLPKTWMMTPTRIPSRTDPATSILKLEKVTPADVQR